MNSGNDASTQFDRTNPFTLMAWVKTTSDGHGAIIAKMNAGGSYRGYDIYYCGSLTDYCNPHTVKFHLEHSWSSNAITAYVSSGGMINDGIWHHVAATYDGSSSANGVKVYIDGVSQSLTLESDGLASTTDTTAPLLIGSRNGGSYFSGFIDEAKVYSGALTGSDILAIYNSEKP